jgi:hypothetical protein
MMAALFPVSKKQMECCNMHRNNETLPHGKVRFESLAGQRVPKSFPNITQRVKEIHEHHRRDEKIIFYLIRL